MKTKKPCPDPRLKYERVVSGEEYWERYARSGIVGEIRGHKYQCAMYVSTGIDTLISTNILISIEELEDRQKKEKGLIKGISIGFEQTREYYEAFSREVVPGLEKVTGLKFQTAKEWFDWWESNKDRLVLSEDGKHLVVNK